MARRIPISPSSCQQKEDLRARKSSAINPASGGLALPLDIYATKTWRDLCEI